MADADPRLLLTLLTVRMLGEEEVPDNDPVLKGYKDLLKQAVEAGYLEQSRIKVESTTKTGRKSTKQVAVYDLTASGKEKLSRSASPEALGAVRAATLAALQERLPEERERMASEIKSALSSSGNKKTEGKIKKEIEGLSKKILDLGQKLEKLEAVVGGTDEAQLLDRIDTGFAALSYRLERALGAGEEGGEEPTSEQSLETILRESYRELCKLLEYQVGLVKLPPLFYEAKKRKPDLDRETFHAELLRLWEERAIELHILNEVYMASEPELGIERNDQLYYFVRWKSE